MPAVSKAQQRMLYAKFGAAWVKRHHYDNPTKNLPEHARRSHGSPLAHAMGRKPR